MASTPPRGGTRRIRHDSAASAAVADLRVPTNRTISPRRSVAPAQLRPAQSPTRRHRAVTTYRRIALITGNFDTVIDGVSRTLTRLVTYLRRHGYDVLVVGPQRSEAVFGADPTYLTVPSVPIPGRPEYRLPLGLPPAARREIESFDPQLVHIATPDLLGLRALAWARARGIPVVSTYHTHFPSYLAFYHADLMKPVVERYLAWFYGRCRHVYVPTPMLEEYARGLGLKGRIYRWGRGVDCRRFHPNRRSEAWRQRRGLERGDVLVTFVGRLVREKGLDVFASVLERLREADAPVRSMIVGEGPLRSELEARLPETLFTGHLHGGDLARSYAASDVFLFPSRTEAFGNVIVEAMASGLPVVAAASSGSSCHVREERTGLLAEAGDVETFFRHTLRLAHDESLRRQMGEQGRLYAKSYDWNRTLARITAYYEEALK